MAKKLVPLVMRPRSGPVVGPNPRSAWQPPQPFLANTSQPASIPQAGANGGVGAWARAAQAAVTTMRAATALAINRLGRSSRDLRSGGHVAVGDEDTETDSKVTPASASSVGILTRGRCVPHYTG